jgi:hypothetical protein
MYNVPRDNLQDPHLLPIPPGFPKENPPDVPKVEGCEVVPNRLGPVVGLANMLLAGVPKPLTEVVVVPNAGLGLKIPVPCNRHIKLDKYKYRYKFTHQHDFMRNMRPMGNIAHLSNLGQYRNIFSNIKYAFHFHLPHPMGQFI